jgi:hypothetical protein
VHRRTDPCGKSTWPTGVAACIIDWVVSAFLWSHDMLRPNHTLFATRDDDMQPAKLKRLDLIKVSSRHIRFRYCSAHDRDLRTV